MCILSRKTILYRGSRSLIDGYYHISENTNRLFSRCLYTASIMGLNGPSSGFNKSFK